MTPGVIQVTDRFTRSHPQFQIVISIEVEDGEVTRLVECFAFLVGMSLTDLPTIEVHVDFPPCLDRVQEFLEPREHFTASPAAKAATWPSDFLIFRGEANPATAPQARYPPVKTNPPNMKIKTDDKKSFTIPIPPGVENGDFGLLVQDFASSELSGCEEGVELKTYTWMQDQTNGPLDAIKTARAIEGWRMRMKREFLKWGIGGEPDCWDYIPVSLREWCDTGNPSKLWKETPVLFLWRCHLWQSRLRGCVETPRTPRDPDEETSLWEEDYGWIYSPIDNMVVWNSDYQVSFGTLPEDVSEFLTRDWLLRLNLPSTPPIWDTAYDALGQMETWYSFETWHGKENWIPDSLSTDEFIVEKWRSLP